MNHAAADASSVPESLGSLKRKIECENPALRSAPQESVSGCFCEPETVMHVFLDTAACFSATSTSSKAAKYPKTRLPLARQRSNCNRWQAVVTQQGGRHGASGCTLIAPPGSLGRFDFNNCILGRRSRTLSLIFLNKERDLGSGGVDILVGLGLQDQPHSMSRPVRGGLI